MVSWQCADLAPAQGLQQQGIGAWKQLQAMLPHMSLAELHFYTRYLLCCHDLDCYLGWQPTQCAPARTSQLAQRQLVLTLHCCAILPSLP